MGLKTVVLNSERMNYDGKLDLSVLSSEVKEYASTEQDQILDIHHRAKYHKSHQGPHGELSGKAPGNHRVGGGAKREKKCHSHQHQERKEQPIPAVPPRK